MKKLLMLIIFGIFLTISGISGENIADTERTHEIYIPTNSYMSCDNDAKIIPTGSFDIVRVGGEHYEDVKADIDKIYGESVSFSGNEKDAESIIRRLNVRIIDRKAVDGKILIFGYSPRIQKSVKHNGKLVNIQLIVGNNKVEIGTPLIMGSY